MNQYQELHPDDARLLKDDDTGEEEPIGSRYAVGMDLPWLMRTQYISNDLYTNKQKGGMSEKKYKVMKQQQKEEEEHQRKRRASQGKEQTRLADTDDEDADDAYEQEDETEKQIEMIEASFRAAQEVFEIELLLLCVFKFLHNVLLCLPGAEACNET